MLCPTGTVHGADAVGAFLDRVLAESDAMVIVDEAYHDYVTDPAYETQIPRALELRRNVVSLAQIFCQIAQALRRLAQFVAQILGVCVAPGSAVGTRASAVSFRVGLGFKLNWYPRVFSRARRE